MDSVIYETNIPEFPVTRGKVRDVYDLGDKLLIVATDRVSAFDVVLNDPIPDKGRVLTGISTFWFEFTGKDFPNHLISVEVTDFPAPLQRYRDLLAGRTMLVKKGEVVPVECIVRGYLSGSGWREYQKNGSVCGILLPSGLKESEKLPEPIFTPTTKASEGHDLPMTFADLEKAVGREVATKLRERSIALYEMGAKRGEESGIIIADTKFEFAWIDGKLHVADEIFTPDSSRFWPMDGYMPGRSQPSFDKQFIRDYLSSLGWDYTPPAPALPPEIISRTREKYLEAYYRITGRRLL